MTLDDYIKLYMETDCEWGVSDCSAFAANWVKESTGFMPKLPLYKSREEAHKLIQDAGGLYKLWNDALYGSGLNLKADPEKGNVGVINTTKFGDVGVIFLNGGYAAWRAERGVSIIMPKNIQAVWG